MSEFRHIVLDVGAGVDPGHVPGVLWVDGGGEHGLYLPVWFVQGGVPVLSFHRTQPEDNVPVAQVYLLE